MWVYHRKTGRRTASGAFLDDPSDRRIKRGPPPTLGFPAGRELNDKATKGGHVIPVGENNEFG